MPRPGGVGADVVGFIRRDRLGLLQRSAERNRVRAVGREGFGAEGLPRSVVDGVGVAEAGSGVAVVVGGVADALPRPRGVGADVVGLIRRDRLDLVGSASGHDVDRDALGRDVANLIRELVGDRRAPLGGRDIGHDSV